MENGNWTFLIFAFEALLASLLCLFMLFALRRTRKQVELLESQLDEQSRQLVSRFLERELASTREKIRLAGPESDQWRKVAQLRMLWLQMEQKLLQNDGKTRSDISLLDKTARPLLAQIASSSPPTTQQPSQVSGRQQTESPQAEDTLKQARSTILMQKEIIDKLKIQLSKASDRSRTTEDADATICRIHDGNEDQLGYVTRLEQELKAANRQFLQASDELQRLKDGSRHSGPAALIVERDGQIGNVEDRLHLDLTLAKTLLSEMQSAHTDGIDELRKIREANSKQRMLILQLEKEIAQLRSEEMASGESQELLEALKRQLRDYENCTAVLEMETESLRSRIGTLNNIINVAEQTGSLDQSVPTQDDMAELKSLRLRSKLFTVAFKRLADIASAQSVDAAIELLSSGFGDPRLVFALLIKGGGKQYWFSSVGTVVDGRLRSLLLSVVPSPDSPWSEVKGGAVFVGNILRIHLDGSALPGSAFDQTCRFLTPQLSVIDGLMQLQDIRAPRDRKIIGLQELVGQAQKQLTVIRMSVSNLHDETGKAEANFLRELQQYYDALALTTVQRECVDALIDDFKSEMKLLAHSFRTITESLNAVGEMLMRRE